MDNLSPRQTVRQAILRTKPSRMPIYFFNRDQDRSDIISTSYHAADSFCPSEPELSEWGYVWQRIDGTMGQPHGCPIQSAEALATYIGPDPKAAGRLAHVPEFIAGSDDKFKLFHLGITGFNQATFIRGFEDFIMDLYADRGCAEAVLDLVFDFETGIIEKLKDYPLDAVAFGDDWGSQQGLMISPALWREVFKPRYARQFEKIHESGKKVWFHSCGDVIDIIPDFIEIGVDVMELLQPDLLGVETLAEQFGDKVCFCCSIDHQRRAISGSKQEIYDYAGLLRDKLGASGGGFIAYIEDYASLGMDEDHYRWICEAFDGLNS